MLHLIPISHVKRGKGKKAYTLKMSLKQFFTVLMAASLGVAATVPKPYASLLSPPPHDNGPIQSYRIRHHRDTIAHRTPQKHDNHFRQSTRTQHRICRRLGYFCLRHAACATLYKEESKRQTVSQRCNEADVFVRLCLVNWRKLYQRAKPNKAGSLSWRGSN